MPVGKNNHIKTLYGGIILWLGGFFVALLPFANVFTLYILKRDTVDVKWFLDYVGHAEFLWMSAVILSTSIFSSLITKKVDKSNLKIYIGFGFFVFVLSLLFYNAASTRVVENIKVLECLISAGLSVSCLLISFILAR
ncbi:MAG: hypothetical protein LBK66_01290 [Spirochaetaceae bacterium]|jgi:hypothetical protein|nr:hypothetical protein [Spirochaetaceae bacterium]